MGADLLVHPPDAATKPSLAGAPQNGGPATAGADQAVGFDAVLGAATGQLVPVEAPAAPAPLPAPVAVAESPSVPAVPLTEAPSDPQPAAPSPAAVVPAGGFPPAPVFLSMPSAPSAEAGAVPIAGAPLPGRSAAQDKDGTDPDLQTLLALLMAPTVAPVMAATPQPVAVAPAPASPPVSPAAPVVVGVLPAVPESPKAPQPALIGAASDTAADSVAATAAETVATLPVPPLAVKHADAAKSLAKTPDPDTGQTAVPSWTPAEKPVEAAAVVPTAPASQPVSEKARLDPLDDQPAPGSAQAHAAAHTPDGTAVVPAPIQAAVLERPASPAVAPAAPPVANPVERIVVQQVGRALLRHDAEGDRRLVIRLTPPELGTVRVEFAERDGTISARIHADDPAVRQALDRLMPQLRDHLRMSDATVQQITIEPGARSDQGFDGRGFDGRGGQQPRSDGSGAGRQRRDGRGGFSLDGIVVDEPAAAPRPRAQSASAAAVDAFA